MTLKKNFLLLFIILSKSLFAITIGFSGSIGGTSYNNRFFLQDEAKEKYKFFQSPIFSPVFFASIDVSLTKYFRLGFEGSIRTEVPFESSKMELIKDKSSLVISSKANSRSLLLKLLYDMPISLKDIGFFGLGIGYSETTLSPWEYGLTKLDSEEKFSDKISGNSTALLVFKIIAGRSFEIIKELYVDFSVEFSVIEWMRQGENILSSEILPEELGVWRINPRTAFPTHPLDVTLGIRKTFTF